MYVQSVTCGEKAKVTETTEKDSFLWTGRVSETE